MKIQKKTEVVSEIVNLYETDSIDTIARKLSISRHVINKILKEAGVELISTVARKGCKKI